MWNVCNMFIIPYGIYFKQTFKKKKIKYSLIKDNGENFISNSSFTLYNMRAEFIGQKRFSNKFFFKYY